MHILFISLYLFIVHFFLDPVGSPVHDLCECVQHVHASDCEPVRRVIEQRCTRRGSTERYGGNGKEKQNERNRRMGEE